MSTIKTTNITHGSNSGTANLVLASDGGVTCKSLDNTPAFSVRLSADQAADSNNTWYKVLWDTEAFDTDSAFASNKFTVPAGKGGVYWVSAQVAVTNQTESAEMDLQLALN